MNKPLDKKMLPISSCPPQQPVVTFLSAQAWAPLIRRDDPGENPSDMIYCSHTSGVSTNTFGPIWPDSAEPLKPKKLIWIQDSIWFPISFLQQGSSKSTNWAHREITTSAQKNQESSKNPEEQIQPNPAVAASKFLPMPWFGARRRNFCWLEPLPVARSPWRTRWMWWKLGCNCKVSWEPLAQPTQVGDAGQRPSAQGTKGPKDWVFRVKYLHLCCTS
jgi:hypothetical protein